MAINMQVALTVIIVIVTTIKAQNLSVESNQTTSGDNNRDKIQKHIDVAPQCIKKPCIRKCCAFGYVVSLGENKCVAKNSQFDFPVYKKENEMNPVEGFNVTEDFSVLTGLNKCSRDEIRTSNSWKLKMFTDGQLYVHIPDNIPDVIIYGPDKYCIDTFVTKNANEGIINAFICFVPEKDQDNYVMSSSCMLVSCFFILLTVAVYAWLPELRNLHGIVLIAYLLSFFVGFLFLGTAQILAMRKNITQNYCTGFTFIIYFSLLSAFFWLNVMCYDIWRTFSGMRAHGQERSTMKRFIQYAIYAFGVPTALTILMAALEFSELPIQNEWLPNLRLQGCFLYGNSKFLYLYVPIMMLCIANMTFFTLTACEIWKIKRETNRALCNKDSSTNGQNRDDTQRFTLYVKLFTVMGISWILEVVSFYYPDADFLWQFSDAYNMLVGLIIFIIFVCKNNTFELIKKRYWHMRGLPMSRTQTTTSTSIRTLSQSATISN